MAEVVKVTTKGQVTLPARIRKSLGIRDDTYLLAEEVGEFVVVHVGFAISRISEDEAREVFRLLETLPSCSRRTS